MAPKNRILWVTLRHPPLGGGMAVSSGRLVENLRTREVDLDVAAFVGPSPRFGVQTVFRDHGLDFLISRPTRQARPGLTAQGAYRLIEAEHRRQPYTRIVGFGAGLAGYLAVIYAAWLGCPALVLVRGNDLDEDLFDPGRGYWVRESLGRAAMIGAVSPDMVRRIKALFPGKEAVFLANGIKADDWRLLPEDRNLSLDIRRQIAAVCPEPNHARVVFGLFGELKYKKGIAFWLGALREAGLNHRLALLIVGRRLDEATSQILDDPVLAPPSLHLPFVTRDRLAGCYAACDFVALPSIFEGLPNTLLEAMATGVPALTSDAGAMAEVVRDGDTGFVFPAGDRDKAAAATHRALSLTPHERLAMGQRSREFVTRHFSVEHETDQVWELLRGLTPDRISTPLPMDLPPSWISGNY